MENVNQDEFYARYDINANGEVFWQRLDDHLREVAEEAYNALKDVDAELASWAKLAGYFHDYGKFNPAFQSRLREGYAKEQAQRIAQTEEERRLADKMPVRKAPHAKLGMDGFYRYWQEFLAEDYLPFGYILVSNPILGHHAGMADEVPVDELKDLAMDESFRQSMGCDLEKLLPSLKDCTSSVISSVGEMHTGFNAMFAMRLVFSALVHADHLRSYAFNKDMAEESELAFSTVAELRENFEEKYRAFTEKKAQEVSQHSPKAQELQQIRSAIYQEAMNASSQSRGIFSLTVPTGGGKTLSSLAFALHHAELHRQHGIIYVAPFTSILDQTVGQYRDYLGKDNVLAHYSTYDDARFRGEQPDDYHPMWYKLGESWQQRVVLTTAVQFWESLFTHQPGRAKKIHNIVNRVIILDEIQSIPRKYLAPILQMIQSLVHYGCTVVLCSATQPKFDATQLKSFGLSNIREIIKDPASLAQSLERITLHLTADAYSLEGLASAISQHQQALVIVNRRATSQELAKLLADDVGEDNLFHLNGLMCVAHRQEVLERIKKEYLALQKPCYLVSTQLVEAGVDIDFPVVYREEAGLENLVQSAGRCNREFRIDRGDFHIFTIEDTKPFSAYKAQLPAYQRMRDKYQDQLFSLASLDKYYQEIYHYDTLGSRIGALDEKGIIPIVSDFGEAVDLCEVGEEIEAEDALTLVEMRKIGDWVRFIEQDQVSIVVPHGMAVDALIQEVQEIGFSRKLLRQLSPYVVGIYRDHLKNLMAKGYLLELKDKYGRSLDYYCFSSTGKEQGVYSHIFGLMHEPPTASDISYF